MSELYKLADALLPWYAENRRELPWRQTKDPYKIWVSEIMLQQTRVEAVKGYYQRFLTALPDVQVLAVAEDEQLHKLWEGLGYYSRVRNLKKAAKIIVEQYGGRFPQSYEEILALPGIGEYTAGAICSIAYNQPIPAVDGNVLRVISRITNDSSPIDLPAVKTAVRQKLAAIYPVQSSDFTQALMELGATLCGPNRKPCCEECPCKSFCLGYQKGTAETLPIRLPKRSRRVEEKTVFILSCEGCYALIKRPDKGLLAGLWQFPDCSHKLNSQQIMDWVEQNELKPAKITHTVERNHIFTHVEWVMRGAFVEVVEKNDHFTWLTLSQIDRQAPLPTAYRQFLNDML